MATLNDSGATQFRDDDLLGNTEYSYTVVVLTERDEEVVSGVRSGAFHRLVDSWELPFDQRAFARIYSEGGRIFVLAKEGGSYSLITSLLEYDAAGQRLNENEILAFGSASGRAMAFSPTGDGGRLFIMANGGLIAKHYEPGERTENWDYVVMAQEADGQMALREHVLSVDGLPTLTDAAQRTVLGEIALSRHVDAETGDLNQGAYRNPQVTRSGSILYAEDFSDLPAFVNARITHAFGSDYFTQWNGWDLYGGGRWTDHGFIILWSGAMYRADPAWQDFQLEVEVSPIGVDTFNPTIYIGGDTYSRYGIGLDLINQEAQLNWQFTPPDGLDMEPQEISLSEPFALVEGLSYWLRVGAVDGEVSASVASPVLANGVGTRGFPWVNMIHLGDIPAVTVYDTPYLLTPDWQWQPLNTFNSGVSELRTWQSRGRRQIGVCLPEDNKLLVGTVPDGLENEWSDLLNSAIGPETGRAADFLFNPTSFDVGPDGRIYVLDAGNARIVVYDSARNYITEWGSYGSGAGQFDFGAQGGRLASGEPSFTGSIAVDDEGFVYVVDPVNGRIQKFEP